MPTILATIMHSLPWKFPQQEIIVGWQLGIKAQENLEWNLALGKFGIKVQVRHVRNWIEMHSDCALRNATKMSWTSITWSIKQASRACLLVLDLLQKNTYQIEMLLHCHRRQYEQFWETLRGKNIGIWLLITFQRETLKYVIKYFICFLFLFYNKRGYYIFSYFYNIVL